MSRTLVNTTLFFWPIQVSIDAPVRISQQRQPTSGSTTITGSCYDALPSDGHEVATAAAVISAAVGKQLFDTGASSSKHPNGGGKSSELTSGDTIRDSRRHGDVGGNASKRDTAAGSTTKAKSEIQKFYQIKEKVTTFPSSLTLGMRVSQVIHTGWLQKISHHQFFKKSH